MINLEQLGWETGTDRRTRSPEIKGSACKIARLDHWRKRRQCLFGGLTHQPTEQRIPVYDRASLL